jgi:hypothetical protein
VLSDNEIRVLWHGLDRADLPWDRRTRLALKFALVSMLRSGELLPIHRSKLAVEDSSGNICVNIPFKRLKNRKHSPEPAAHEAAAERSGDGDRQRSREEQRAAVCVREPPASR